MLETSDLTVMYGGLHANDGVDIRVAEGELYGLIGPNGAGKTTFIDAITGFARPTAGRVVFRGLDVTGLAPSRRAQLGLIRTFQSVQLFDDLSVMENLLVASERATWWTFLSDLAMPQRSPAAIESAEWALDLLGLGNLAELASGDLSQGQRKLVGVARALAARPRMLLVDEPAAGLDAAESVELGRRLRRVVDSGITVLLVEHDMRLVLSTCDRIGVLDSGRLIAQGGPQQIRTDPTVVTAYLGRTAGEPQSQKIAVREEMREPAEQDPVAAEVEAHEGAVLVLKGLVAGYEGAPIVHGLDLHVRRGEVVALLGPNGAGKTTTLLTVSGILEAIGGEIAVLDRPLGKLSAHEIARRGVAHVAEGRSLFFDLTVDENLRLGQRAAGRQETRKGIAEALELFPTLGPLRQRKAGVLSGGEQQMLALARAIVSKPRVLLVDELSLGLGPVVVERLLPLVRELAHATRCGVLLVEQHARVALEIADRAYVLANGRIVLSGGAAQLARRRDLFESIYLGGEATTQIGGRRS